MNAAKRASHAYAKWFDERAETFVTEQMTAENDAESYLQANARFITLTFDKRMITRRKSVLNDSSGVRADQRGPKGDPTDAVGKSPEFFNVDRLYKTVCQALLGTNWARRNRRELQPLMIAAADVNGTRYGRPATNENLHLHTLWICRPDQIDKFDAVMERIKNDPRHVLDFEQIDIVPVHDMKARSNGVSRLSSYMAKFLGMNATDMIVPHDTAVYPQPLS